MSGIDAVIARSRRPGGFSERKQFTVARSRGIQKLRRFALADPHFYILELIQSAIANGARHIDIALEAQRCTVSYIGGGLHEAELGHLFDFLFASKDRTDIGHVRELALGINAVLLFEPDRVVVESGDGTLSGTTRMVMHGDSDQVEVGRPERPLTGTYVHIEGMKRSNVPGGWAVRDTPRERGVIEENCLAAPIPIIVNHESLFGYSSQRTPGVFGYRRALALDEGDLYGTIGVDPSFGKPSFQLLTRGVAIQSKEYELLPGQKIGGVICFDTLRKTVDHSGIVEDDRLEEMWVRLRPYARQLVTGKQASSPYETTLFGGTALPAAELRQLLREHERVVVVRPDTRPDTAAGRRAVAIGRALQAPVLSSPSSIVPSLRALSGGRVAIVAPDLDSDLAVPFYESDPLEPPARPWLTAPVEVEPLDIDLLAGRIFPRVEYGKAERRDMRMRLGEVGRVEATVYTPQETAHERDGLWVWVSTTQRLVSHHVVPSAYPGHVLIVRIPDVDPFQLLDPIDREAQAPSLAAEVARAMAEHASPTLAAAFDGAVRSLGVRALEPGTTAAGLGLAALTRGVVPRLRTRDDAPSVDLVQLEAGQVDLLELPLLRTRAGRTVCMREVTDMMDACGGLLYGTVPSVPAAMDELDPDRVLELDEASERLLVTLFGEGPYVRIDRRDVLAEFRGVQCRDLALGLREYADFPLLVEGEDPSRWSEEDRRACEHALVDRLVKRFAGISPPSPTDPAEHADWEECRRQACRHLQWFVCQRGRIADAPDYGVGDLPLFLDAAGEARTYREVRSAMDRSSLTLVYGHALGGAELGTLAGAMRRDEAAKTERQPPQAIVAGPWLHRLLAPLGDLRLAFDFDAPASDRPDGVCDAFIVSVALELEGCRGRVGVPARPMVRKDVPVILPDNRQMSVVSDLAVTLGVAGWVRLEPSTKWTNELGFSLVMAIRTSAQEALSKLLERLPTVNDPEERNRYLDVLLGYAARHTSVSVDPHGKPHVNFVDDVVARILSIPVFPSRFGGVLSAWRLLRRFCGLLVAGADDPAREILGELRSPLPAPAHDWIRRALEPRRVVRAPAHDVVPPPPPPSPSSTEPGDHPTLCATLEYWLARLRPDMLETNTRIYVFQRDPEVFAEGVMGSVRLNADHWLVAWALRSAHVEPQVIAWLLLAVYAHINAEVDQVTNEHERTFQRAVLATLDTGELRLVESAAPSSGDTSR